MIKLDAAVMNSTLVAAVAEHCEIDLTSYNYSLYRAAMASCNQLNGQRAAEALVLGFAGATFWICGELVAQLAFRFTSWRTLYPWYLDFSETSRTCGLTFRRTILISTLGTIVITGSHILNHLGNAPTTSLILEATGWICMVTGFALVLYSRLHILINDRRVLRACLGIIVINALICHPPVIVASVYTGIHKKTLLRAGFCLDVLFVLQENVFALLYIFSFVKFVGGWHVDKEAKAVLRNLILAEVIVFCTDITPLSLLYAQAYVPREAIHPFCYAVKLTIEFWILNDLVRFSRARQGAVTEDIFLHYVAGIKNDVDTPPSF